jgi:hypothetical protein
MSSFHMCYLRQHFFTVDASLRLLSDGVSESLFFFGREMICMYDLYYSRVVIQPLLHNAVIH